MTPQVPALPGMTPMGFRPSSQPSSSGGTIVYTKTGLIHHSGRAYSGKIAATEAQSSAKKA